MGTFTNYEYLDHTADIQLHSWGHTLDEAIGHCVVAMYGYMTADITTVEPVYTMDFHADGDDLCSLVYNLLDACLYRFVTEPFFIGVRCEVVSLEIHTDVKTTEDEEGFEEFKGSNANYRIHLRVWGESFDIEKHPPGTEVKAITYSNLQVLEPCSKPETNAQQKDNIRRRAEAKDHNDIVYERHDDQYHVFVIVDI